MSQVPYCASRLVVLTREGGGEGQGKVDGIGSLPLPDEKYSGTRSMIPVPPRDMELPE